jgi:aminobenzoyl-glutamate utilization protein B
MRISLLSLLVYSLTTVTAAADQPSLDSVKQAAIIEVVQQEARLIELSDAVWGFAETALAETQSAQVLADYAEEQGFRVTRGVGDMPTAFIAEYGSGRPIIGILGEYDALPRLSQAAIPEHQPILQGGSGHGCGHNLFGAASLGAATAIKRLIDAGTIAGTVRYYGTPAEEAVGGKVYLARDGFFDDLDAAFSWHPNSHNEIDVSGSQAMVETQVEFRGTSSHAAFDPWNGRSALDGLELFTHSLNMWREHVRPTTRIHYSITDGGGAPNVVPETAGAVVWIRDRELEDVMPLLERMREMAAGSAQAANVTAEVILLSGTYSMKQNKAMATLAHANMEALGPIEFDAADERFARRLQRAMGVPTTGLDGSITPLNLEPTEMTGGSTDVADVSWIVPTVDVNVATAPLDIPWHSWGVTAASGTAMGHKGMHYAAKVLATTAVDLFLSPEALALIKAEFAESVGSFKYTYYISDGPPPLPKY